MLRKLTTMSPSAVSATVLPWSPLGAPVLKRQRVGRRVEVLPASPLPHDDTGDGHLDEVVAVDRPVHLGAGQSALDPVGDLGGEGPETQQQNVAVTEPARVVVMVRMPDFPQHLPVPIRFEDGAALEAGPRLEAREVLHDLAAIEQMPAREQMAVKPRPVGQPPSVRDLAVHVDEIHCPVAVHRGEQRVARLRARRVMGDEPGARTPDLLLIHRAHGATSCPTK